MIRPAIVFALSAVLACSSVAQAANPVPTEFCIVAQQPERFAEKVIEVRALQTKLKNGEWGLLGDCWPPILLGLPKDVSPEAEFSIEESPAFTQLMAARGERVSLTATFVGRFDAVSPPRSEEGRVRQIEAKHAIDSAESVRSAEDRTALQVGGNCCEYDCSFERCGDPALDYFGASVLLGGAGAVYEC